MSALTKARTNGSQRFIREERRPLAADAKVFQGGLAVIVLSGTGKGYYKQGTSADIAVAVGRYKETVDNTGGADGAKSAQVDFFRDFWIMLLANDVGTALTAADRGSPCWVFDDQTVTGAQNDAFGGVVYDVTTEGVWVEFPPTAAAKGGGGVIPAFAKSVHEPVATVTALGLIAAADRANGMLCLVLSDMSMWRFNSTATSTDTSQNLVVTPAAGAGRWMRHDRQVALSLPVAFGTADLATLFTVPTGAILHPRESWWDVLTDWSGGASSAIGLATSVAGSNTAGDLLGGAAGDVAATLVAANVRETGTIGTKLATRTLGRIFLIAADTIKFNRITSAFTAGTANARVLMDVIANPGA